MPFSRDCPPQYPVWREIRVSSPNAVLLRMFRMARIMTRNDYCLALAILAVSGIFLGGCGGKLPYEVVKLEGTVTYQGKPLEGACVHFQPDSGRESSSISGSGGVFAMKYTYDVDGVQKGAGKFYLTMPEEAGSLAGSKTGRSPLLAEAVKKYSLEKTNRRAEITKADKKYELKLD